MKKWLLSLCMVLALTACDNKKEETQANAKPIIKIGASFPLSGNMASIGNAAHKALAASISDANTNPDNKYYYELLVENDQMDPKLVNNIANKYIFSDKINVIFSYFSTANRVVAPLAARHKIINFMTGFGEDILQSKYNFQNFLTYEAENEAIIHFFEKMNIKNVDLIYQNIGAADQLLYPLQEKLKAKGIEYTVHRFNKEERDFSTLVFKVKNSPSQAVFIYAFEPEADILTTEIKRQKVDKIIAYNDGLPMTTDYALYEGYYNVGSILTPAEYQKAWGLEGQNAAYAAYLYDSGKIVVDAFENATTVNKIPTSDEVADYLLNKKDYSGIIGKYTLDSKGQFHSKGQTSVVKNEHLVVYGE